MFEAGCIVWYTLASQFRVHTVSSMSDYFSRLAGTAVKWRNVMHPLCVLALCTVPHDPCHYHTYTHSRTHTCTRIRAHTHARTHVRTHARTHTHTHTHTCTHARTYEHAHTHTHTRTHARTHHICTGGAGSSACSTHGATGREGANCHWWW